MPRRHRSVALEIVVHVVQGLVILVVRGIGARSALSPQESRGSLLRFVEEGHQCLGLQDQIQPGFFLHHAPEKGDRSPFELPSVRLQKRQTHLVGVARHGEPRQLRAHRVLDLAQGRDELAERIVHAVLLRAGEPGAVLLEEHVTRAPYQYRPFAKGVPQQLLALASGRTVRGHLGENTAASVYNLEA